MEARASTPTVSKCIQLRHSHTIIHQTNHIGQNNINIIHNTIKTTKLFVSLSYSSYQEQQQQQASFKLQFCGQARAFCSRRYVEFTEMMVSN
jgi:hypothetical protein